MPIDWWRLEVDLHTTRNIDQKMKFLADILLTGEFNFLSWPSNLSWKVFIYKLIFKREKYWFLLIAEWRTMKYNWQLYHELWVLKSYILHRLLDNSLGNPTFIPRRHLWKRKSWTIIGLFYIPLEFQPKMKNWIYHHSTGFLNYTSVLSNSTILLGLPNAPLNLFPNY